MEKKGGKKNWLKENIVNSGNHYQDKQRGWIEKKIVKKKYFELVVDTDWWINYVQRSTKKEKFKTKMHVTLNLEKVQTKSVYFWVWFSFFFHKCLKEYIRIEAKRDGNNLRREVGGK